MMQKSNKMAEGAGVSPTFLPKDATNCPVLKEPKIVHHSQMFIQIINASIAQHSPYFFTLQ
jgi:hypothetical protein